MEYEVEVGSGIFVIKEKDGQYVLDLRNRLLKFAVNVIRFLMELPTRREFDVFRYQLSKSATSIGANFEEAQSSSYNEFVQKMRIALREANESKYWLQIITELKLGDHQKRELLLTEINELSLILGSIVSTAHKKLKNTK